MLGTKVKCNSYLKKTKKVYVYANEQHIRDAYKEHADEYMMTLGENIHILESDENYIQDTFEETETTFEGIIIGKKNVSTATSSEVATDFFDEPLDQVRVTKINYRLCYHVAYRMGGTRLVPIERTELVQ